MISNKTINRIVQTMARELESVGAKPLKITSPNYESVTYEEFVKLEEEKAEALRLLEVERQRNKELQEQLERERAAKPLHDWLE